MSDLTERIEESIRDDSLEIRNRTSGFLAFRNASKEDLFGELCFCILAANTSAEMGIRIQNAVGNRSFLDLDLNSLRCELHRLRCRFYNTRSRFIFSAREVSHILPDLVNWDDKSKAREFLVDNVYGIGFKEASHFLRNVGTFDFAILDKHITGMIAREFGLEPIKSFSRKRYLEVEALFLKMAEEFGLPPGILDLHMWKIATGKVLK